MNISFENTKIAFSDKSKKELIKAFWLFKTVESPLVVRIGEKLLKFALFVKFPVKWIIKPTIFSHFCGGETMEECKQTITRLSKSNIKTILDYSAEGIKNESSFDNVKRQIIEIIELAKNEINIPFAVFKVTGIARFDLLEKVSNKSKLNTSEFEEFERVKNRIDEICAKGFENDIPILIDAEESWIQDAIDEIVDEMMIKYNRNKAIVYNTIQLYRTDRLDFLTKKIEFARKNNFYLGFKLVRGAYMEKERERALKYNYVSPIHVDKKATDEAFNKALILCIDNIDVVSICNGSHNEYSNLLMVKLINERKLEPGDKRLFFAQLLGMSDHISYNLANAGYNVAKYVPFGPVKTVIPYLIRRAKENTSIAGQSGRELLLIKKELKMRK